MSTRTGTLADGARLTEHAAVRAAPAALESSVRVNACAENDEVVWLMVYGWQGVQPGTLSWMFPSVRAALAATETMKNAVCWAIVRWSGLTAEHEAQAPLAPPQASLEELRTRGAVLIEQTG
jgi:hypothetical protein